MAASPNEAAHHLLSHWRVSYYVLELESQRGTFWQQKQNKQKNIVCNRIWGIHCGNFNFKWIFQHTIEKNKFVLNRSGLDERYYSKLLYENGNAFPLNKFPYHFSQFLQWTVDLDHAFSSMCNKRPFNVEYVA